MSMSTRLRSLRSRMMVDMLIDLQEWRDWFADAMAVFALFLFLPAMAIAFPILIAERLYWLIAFDIGILLAIIIRLFTNLASYKYRAYFLLAILYAMAITYLISLGPHYARPGWLVMLTVIASLLFGVRAAVFSSSVNAAMLVMLYWVIRPGNQGWASEYAVPFGNLVMFVTNLSLISLGCSLPVGFLINRLDRSIRGERDAREMASQEREKLGTAYGKLQAEILERKQAEEAQKASEERFREMADLLPQAIYEANIQGFLTYVNRHALGLFGYTQEDFEKGMNVLQTLIPQERDRALSTIQAILTGKSSHVSREYQALRKDGMSFPIETYSSPIINKGGALGLRGVIVDLTERKQAEESLRKSEARFQELFNEAPVGYHGIDAEGRITQVNCTELKMLGYSLEEMLDQPIWDFVEEREESEKVVKAQLAGAIPATQHRERTFRRKDGTTFPALIQNRILRNSEDGIIGIRSTLQDISERKKVEMEAKRLAHEHSALAEIGRIISSTLNIEEVYKAFAEKVRELIGFDRIVIGLIDAEENKARFPYIEGLVVPGREPEDVLPLAGTAIEKVFQARAGMIIAMESEEEIGATVPGLLPEFRYGIRSALTVPLISRDRVIGALLLRSTVPGIYTERHLKLVESIGNQIAGAIANSQLFAERQQAEEALRESEIKYREIFESIEDVYYQTDSQGILRVVSPSMHRISGWKVEEIIGKPVTNVYPDPSSREKFLSVLAEDGFVKDYELLLKKKEGTTIPVSVAAHLLFDDQGRPTGVGGMLRDITERKRAEEALRKSEERFRELYDHAPVGYHEFDLQGRIIDANRTDLEMLGYDRKEMIGRNAWDLGLEAERYRERVLDKLAGRRPPDKNLERIYLRKDGTTFPVLIEDRVVLDERGKIRGIRSTIQDITERKWAEEERAVLSDQLHQAQKMEAIGTLAGGIAHDFNNILSAILGYAELASLDLEEGSRARNNLEHSMRAAYRARDLVVQILAFSRQGKQERKLLNIIPIAKEALKFLRASLPATIEIQEDIEEDSGTIEADPTQIHQVLMNLCTNAAHAMEEKGGVLKISASNLDLDRTSAVSGEIEAGSYLRLRVSDTGYGMPPEILRRIFDPYFTTKERGKGTGLGLAVVHGIVKSYGGGITVSSEVGKGSTFDIYFPRTETAMPLEVYKAEPLPLGGHERVLFVDDEVAIVEIGREILEHLGYEVTTRTSSIEALELFRAEPGRFDLVITDMTMPNMRGDKLAQELLKIRPQIPIILCTGFSEHITEESANAIGIRGFVMKPMAMMELAKAIRRVLSARNNKKN